MLPNVALSKAASKKFREYGCLLALLGTIFSLILIIYLAFQEAGKPIRSINEDTRAAELRIKLEDPNATRVSDLLSGDEDFLCVMYQLGIVSAKNDKFNKKSKLRQLDLPWIADDGYWSIVIYSKKNIHMEKVFGINRSLMEIDSNEKDICFSSDAIITRSQKFLPNARSFIEFNQEN